MAKGALPAMHNLTAISAENGLYCLFDSLNAITIACGGLISIRGAELELQANANRDNAFECHQMTLETFR